MENKKSKISRRWKINVTMIIAIFVIIGCNGEQKDAASKTKDSTEKLQEEKPKINLNDSLKYHIYKNSELQKNGYAIENISFNETGSYSMDVVALEYEKYPDVVGVGVCKLAAEYLSKNNVDMSKTNIHVHVESLEKGVTGRNLVRSYGKALYNSNNDQITLKPAK
jgi:hypothetical protein